MEELCRLLNAGRFISRGKGRHATRVIDSYELILVIAGTLRMFEEESEFALQPGDRLLLRPGLRHGGTAAYEPGLSFYWCHYRPRGEVSRERLDALAGMGKSARPERFSVCFGMLLAEQRDRESGSAGSQRRLDLLGELLLSEAAESCAARPGNEPDPLAERARRYIKLHYEESISTASLAGELRCHPDYLGRLYRKNFGISVTDEINRVRVAAACRALRETGKSVKEIAFEAGFNDLAYFRRRFFRECGLSPARYRAERDGEHVNTE